MPVKSCFRCGRMIDRAGFCSDCQSLFDNPLPMRCDICGANRQHRSIYYNKKLRKNYCNMCLEIFVNGLRDRGIDEKRIREIIKNDFKSS